MSEAGINQEQQQEEDIHPSLSPHRLKTKRSEELPLEQAPSFTTPRRERLAAPLLVKVFSRSLPRNSGFNSKQIFVDFVTNLVSEYGNSFLFGRGLCVSTNQNPPTHVHLVSL
jgi:hypothetical protein